MSSSVFVDTNVFLRFVLADHALHSPQARAFFGALERGEFRAWTTHVAVSELIWVLTGPQKRIPRRDVANALTPFLTWPNLEIPEAEVLANAIEIFVDRRIDWVDAYHAAAAMARDDSPVVSFDTDYDGVPGITRIAPADVAEGGEMRRREG